MKSDPVRAWLQEADEAAGPLPAVPADLAARVRRAAALRSGRQRTCGVAAAILLACGLLATWPRPAQEPPAQADRPVAGAAPAPVPDAALLAKLQQLDAEAEMWLFVARKADEYRQARQAARPAAALPEVPDVVARTRRELDQAALTLVQQADRMCRELHQCQTAAVRYRRVVDLFPDSPWATVARQRLDELKHKGELS
jgi:hypothetical protein